MRPRLAGPAKEKAPVFAGAWADRGLCWGAKGDRPTWQLMRNAAFSS